MRSVFTLALGLAFTLSPCSAQYEIGGFFGYGWYNNGTIFSSAGTAQAGIRNRFAAGAYISDNRWDYISGELRYIFQDGHPFLNYKGTRVDIQGQSQTITYDLLFYVKSPEHKLRPFVAAGAGVKGFLIAGPEPFPQPFPAIATLNESNQWKFVTDIGGGVKYRIGKHVLLRAEFRDYITTFPSRELTPAPHGTARGVFNQFTPMFGISYVFPDRSW
ncbi:MAG TPA: outer membrane beta-barrel protein [Bryobacteraceae bacterium]|nr:outer membrane beta-barrel protein [Bryobacteraceae bacterium]